MSSSKILVAVLLGLLSSIWKRYCSKDLPPTTQEESWVGWLSWTFLYLGCLCSSYTRQPPGPPLNATKSPNEGLWSKRLTVAGLSAVAIVAQFSQGQGIFPSANPIVTLATFLTALTIPANHDNHRLLEAGQVPSDQDLPEPSSLDKPITPLRIPFRIPVNILLVLLLAGSSFPLERPLSFVAATSLLFVVAQTVIFTSLPRLSHKNQLPLPAIHALLDWDLLERLSLSSVACFTCLLIYSISVSTTSLPDLLTLSRAITESALWISLFILCSENLSTTATTFETVATSFDVVTSSNGGLGLLSASIASIVALWQSVTGVPPSRKSRNWLYLLVAIPLLSLGHGNMYRSIGSKQPVLTMSSHPVESIVDHARNGFVDLLGRQSRTVEEARMEYTKRYEREPPPNFDKWFDIAMQHDFVLVDEFDSMMRAFEPFWGVPSLVLQRLVKNAHERSSGFLIKYEILDGRTAITGGYDSSWFAGSMSRLLPAEWTALLPNMTLAVNVFDEPSVCAPRDIIDRALEPLLSKDVGLSSFSEINELDSSHSPRFLSIGRQDAWEAMTLSCPAESPARNPFCVLPVSGGAPYFIRNLTRSRDICEHCELQDLEGFLAAPETLHLTHSLIPIWSQGKPSSFNDIVFPSPYYMARSTDYVETEDPEWGDKASRLYWVGAATGGHATEANWKQMQRQRMALMTQVGSITPIRLLRETEHDVWTPYTTDMSQVSSLFSTRVVGVSGQCEDAACQAEKQAFGIGDEEVKDQASAAYKHKFVLDLDGNSFSGRFYRLLQSKSMVIKQTVFEEWHDDRLIPWIHYIPVSTGFEELPELVRYLATTERGEELAARIAQDGRDWAGKALRQVDMQLVWLRMLLEYGRIMNPNRDD
ncbi:hypothetical protein H2200_001385 [Cladophialophora chaetospira]|uniref:Glycosyl transferase CAP10 domain-containing protein n=1 Tax=Cladophialophora chaetospira TaxID=386627 RepID=A0AA39CPK0_9EURO|nr:hypothetical protein H2200_001385 [Cladophialophora chaetospira]